MLISLYGVQKPETSFFASKIIAVLIHIRIKERTSPGVYNKRKKQKTAKDLRLINSEENVFTSPCFRENLKACIYQDETRSEFKLVFPAIRDNAARTKGKSTVRHSTH
jgi:hypothetical protein